MHRTRSTHRFAKTINFCVAIVLFSGCASTGQSGYPIFRNGNTTISDVAEHALQGVVNVASTKTVQSPMLNDPFFRFFFEHPFFGGRQPREQKRRSLGSGVIISDKGIVVTNNHVVDKADEIEVSLADGRKLKATIVGKDPRSDLAVLRLKGDLSDLTTIPFGDSDALRLGEPVLAIGNPFGVGQTVTMGIVSAKGRSNMGILDYEDFIQTDAAINPGNSGGALVNMRGELVGINTAIVSRSGGYQGIGFAIPSNIVRQIEQSILRHGRVVRGWLGAETQDLTAELAKAFGTRARQGVVVSDVAHNSPAERAGIKRGDVVLELNGRAMNGAAQFDSLIAAMGANNTAKIKLSRQGKAIAVTAKLIAPPGHRNNTAEVEPDDGVLGGIRVVGITEKLRKQHDLPKSLPHGVIVVALKKPSPASRSGIQPGDIIMEVNRQQVTTAAQFIEAYRKNSDRTLLLLYRNGATQYLMLQP